MRYRVPVSALVAVLGFSLSAAAQQISGDYLETRSADVYTGQCFANGEVNLVGNEAILAWHVQSGTWNGVPLDGLSVAAAVRAKGSLGEKDHLCGNEVTFYPPLTELAHSMPAVAVTDQYRGPGLGVSWDLHGKRSAFIGSFAR